MSYLRNYRIEGNPFITRFKTVSVSSGRTDSFGIEGNPFITRFKTFVFSCM